MRWAGHGLAMGWPWAGGAQPVAASGVSNTPVPGQWGWLTAWRIQQLAQGVRGGLLEHNERLGGNHIWSFFARDLSHEPQWLEPLVAHRRPAYDIRFPSRSRTLTTHTAWIRYGPSRQPACTRCWQRNWPISLPIVCALVKSMQDCGRTASSMPSVHECFRAWYPACSN